MAEPEDVEEDLFADLYDADESSNQPTSAAQPPKPSDSAPTAVPAQPTAQTHIPQSTYDHTQSMNQHDGGYQNGASAQSGSGFAHAAAGPPSGEPEPQGTGIKEDG
ncbi:hypothetical protein HFD88_003401 [Aspergillus terreus]|nr:hypothetical protein HFD88_003401 [Aspergillus terreus]